MITLAEFIRKHAAEQLSIARAMERGVRRGDVEALHDFRVALRRLRALLQAFRKALADTPAAAIEAELRAILKELGPARDTDVWREFMIRRLKTDDPVAQSLLEVPEQQKRQHREHVCQLLGSPRWRGVKRELDALIRRALAKPTGQLAQPLARPGRKAMKKAVRRVRRRSRGWPDLNPEEMHRLRIACRKARYLAEFLTPYGSRDLARLAARFKHLQDLLGDIHDYEVFMERLSGLPVSEDLRREIQRKHRRARERFEEAWERFRKNELRKARSMIKL